MSIITRTFFFLFLSGVVFSQQISIPRIEQMPNHPSPYIMRNWRNVALGYDSIVFDKNKTGQYLPLIFHLAQGTNYPQNPFFGLHTVVGTTYPNSTEAINAMPAVIGATLCGVNKSNQNGYNYVLMCQDYFNKRATENIYLNSPNTTSGDDWWYETMPNIYFMQLNDLYPNLGDFNNQFFIIASRWMSAVNAMGGNTTPWSKASMNYRAWKFSTMTPLTTGIIEPEAAGAISWILYNSFKKNNNEDFRIAAEQSMEFLNDLTSNPCYELQLAYGASIAAKMNAEIGTNYNTEKLVNWCFDVGPLRNWGSLIGNWGGYDISGLIGENGSNGYAFIMNAFQQAGALVPLVRYDDRYARAIGKWVLNVANATRLFYPNYLPDQNQDGRAWSRVYDPQSYIAHEAMHQEQNGFSPYATGDAISGGWGLTNLSLYSSSSVGYLGSLIDTTIVPEILKIDLIKTDFYHDPAYASFLYYNPYAEAKNVSLILPAGVFDIYDAVSNTYIHQNVSGISTIPIPADNAIISVLIPSGGLSTIIGGKLLVNGVIVDHNYALQGNIAPRIKSLKALKNPILQNTPTTIYCTAVDNNGDAIAYTYTATGGTLIGSGSIVNWKSPDTIGTYTIKCITIDSGGASDTAVVLIDVIQRINHDPQILELKAIPQKTSPGATIQASCNAIDPDGDSLFYQWKIGGVTTGFPEANTAITLPNAIGNYYLLCRITDSYGGTVSDSIVILVRDLQNYPIADLKLFLPFTGNALDESGKGHSTFLFGATAISDRFGISGRAMNFDGINDYIQVQNRNDLNFQSGITLNFWMKPRYFYDREQYPVSHGNWENRWKVSVTNKKIRWTIKTNYSQSNGIRDLDSRTVLQVDSLYNITTLFDGMGMEIYVNGKLDAACPWSGDLQVTTYDLMVAQVLPGNSNYNFNGDLDDIRLYDAPLKPEAIALLYDLPNLLRNESQSESENSFSLFPNPSNNQVSIYIPHSDVKLQIIVINLLGEVVFRKNLDYPGNSNRFTIDLSGFSSGIYLINVKNEFISRTKKLIIIK